MTRFVHCGDWQLGMARHFLSDDAQARFGAARLDAITRIGAIAGDEGCDFVVVCGDVFESNHIQRQVLVRALEKMAATPDVAYFLLPGNHDCLDGSSIYRSPTFADHKPANVTVLDGSGPVQAAPGVEIVAAPWPNKHPGRDLVNEACDGLDPPQGLRIVAGHGAVDTMSPVRDDPRLIALAPLQDKIAAGLLHYVALGDRHSTTAVGDSGRVWYAGTPEPTRYDETDPGNVLIVDLDAPGGAAEVTARRVGTWRFAQRDWELSADADIDDLEAWLRSLPDKDRTIVKVTLVGQVSVAQKARIDSVIDLAAEVLAALETWQRRSDLVVVPDSADLDHFALSGFARDAVREISALAARPADEPDSAAARDALMLLHRLVADRS